MSAQTTATATADLTGAMLVKRSRSVWGVLTAATLLFLLSCGSLAYWLSSTLSNFTIPHSATLEARTGSQLVVQRNRVRAPESVTAQTVLNEGDEVQTSSSGGAFIQLFDGSTIQTYFDTSLLVRRRSIRKLVSK